MTPIRKMTQKKRKSLKNTLLIRQSKLAIKKKMRERHRHDRTTQEAFWWTMIFKVCLWKWEKRTQSQWRRQRGGTALFTTISREEREFRNNKSTYIREQTSLGEERGSQLNGDLLADHETAPPWSCQLEFLHLLQATAIPMLSEFPEHLPKVYPKLNG